jgi:hypothetical protein
LSRVGHIAVIAWARVASRLELASRALLLSDLQDGRSWDAAAAGSGVADTVVAESGQVLSSVDFALIVEFAVAGALDGSSDGSVRARASSLSLNSRGRA